MNAEAPPLQSMTSLTTSFTRIHSRSTSESAVIRSANVKTIAVQPSVSSAISAEENGESSSVAPVPESAISKFRAIPARQSRRTDSGRSENRTEL